jgi:aspartyl-tRNA(Asn)/glutamyl-tRNA(Gln) amidotransferase subunit A
MVCDPERELSEQPTDLSRRAFIAMTALGAVGSVAFVSTKATSESATDLTMLSIQEAAEQIRRRQISPVELTNACLTRIERLDPVLNAFITVTAESAFASAREAEVEIQRGRWCGPLHGIPIALKDLFDTAGVRTTAASGVFKNRVPKEDAEVVRKLKAAGAVLLGKTNMHEFAFGGTSAVSAFGAVHNPWDLHHVAGGSSGGSAAAVAAGLCYGALGSDTAASIRQPAAFCGIVGLKPTYGLVSTRGVIPLSWTFDHVGPMTRTVADAAIMLQAIAGYDPADSTSRQLNIPDYSAGLQEKVSTIRVGVSRGFFFDDLDPEIEAVVRDALRLMQQLTAGLRDVTLPASTQEELRAAVRAAEAYAYHTAFLEKSPELYQPETLMRLRAGADVKTTAYIQGRREVELTRRTIGKVFDDVDVIVTPTTAVQPPSLREVSKNVSTSVALSTRTIRNTSPFNVYGWPTISIPCGFTRSGLPIGLQISGRASEDAVVLRFAHAYEQATEWHTRRPPLKPTIPT